MERGTDLLLHARDPANCKIEMQVEIAMQAFASSIHVPRASGLDHTNTRGHVLFSIDGTYAAEDAACKPKIEETRGRRRLHRISIGSEPYNISIIAV